LRLVKAGSGEMGEVRSKKLEVRRQGVDFIIEKE